MQEAAALDIITSLSREFGTPDYVKGGGGNTSVKTGNVIWIKPSGTTLAGMTPEAFVAVDRRALSVLYTMDVPPAADEREAKVKNTMTSAVCGGSRGRPSVETPLHDMLDFTYVVHTHPALVNGLTCACAGKRHAAALFPDALWVPYTDPGFILSMTVRDMVAAYQKERGFQSSVILLENHGIFVGADSPEEIRAIYASVMNTLRSVYQKAGVSTELTYTAPEPSSGHVDELKRELSELLGPAASGVHVSRRFNVAPAPLSPDHMVYAKAYPFDEPLNEAHVKEFIARHGYAPRVIVTADAVAGVGKSGAAAALALVLTQDGALVQQLTPAFGGVQFMSESARAFIESWEVESYREQQLARPA
jgi:rhamnose utilization protein RhaD (predicted bifunctional aldolase and dehydrogenase)